MPPTEIQEFVRRAPWGSLRANRPRRVALAYNPKGEMWACVLDCSNTGAKRAGALAHTPEAALRDAMLGWALDLRPAAEASDDRDAVILYLRRLSN